MVLVNCPAEGCDYNTGEQDPAIGAVLLTYHLQSTHAPAAQAPARAARAEVKKPDRPVLKEDSTDQDWASFEFEWGRYCMAVGIAGKAGPKWASPPTYFA